MNNKDRALKVKKLLGMQGEDSENEYYRVADVLCDLKHFCDEFKIDFNEEVEQSEVFYQFEIDFQNESDKERLSKK
jgi:hypothetical protein|tara:strand:- start:43 stop:270 length:228 start_codon:yes stop_codon:yes gene_type:complete